MSLSETRNRLMSTLPNTKVNTVRIGKFNCIPIKKEDVQAYRSELINILCRESMRPGIGYIFMANPTEKKSSGIIKAYDSNRADITEISETLYDWLIELEDFNDEYDSIGIESPDEYIEGRMKKHPIIIQKGNLYSKE